MYKIVRWSFNNLHVSMIQGPDRVLFCTSRQLCNSLGIGFDALRYIKSAYKAEFVGLSVSSTHVKEFLQEHKVELKVVQ